MTEKVYLSLGSNQGDSGENLLDAVRELAQRGLRILDVSGIYITEPVGFKEQPDFLNLVLLAETDMEPLILLNQIAEIEELLGRVREVRWGPRTIDIDILFFGDRKIHTAELIIPHPRISERAFVLIPLKEIDHKKFESLKIHIPGQKISLLTPGADVKMILNRSITSKIVVC